MTFSKEINDKPGLRRWVLFSLFATSYTPLFVLIVFKQLSQNLAALDWMWSKGVMECLCASAR